MKIIGYVRVSQVADRDGERFISPDVQRETMTGFVTGKGHQLIDVVDDLGESGGGLDRPGLDRVLERLDAGEADGLAVAYLSRLSRRVIDGLVLAQRLRDAGRALLVADLDLDTSTPTGKAMLGVALAFAELELDTRRESWATSQMRAMRRGVYPGSTPTGFTRDDDGRMIPDPVAGPAVVRLFERRAAGASWSELARLLDLELPRADGAPWRASTVADMVTTPMYVGRLERTIGGDRIVVDGAHEALVSRALWERVVNGRQAARGPSRREQPAMLAGLVRCAGCGGPMSRGTGGQKRSADGKVRVYDAYVCLTRCDRPAQISVGLADRHVLGAVIDRLAASRAVGTARTPDDELEGLERALEHDEAEQAAFHRAISVLDVGEAAYRRAAREKRERVEEAQRRLVAAAARAQAIGPMHVELLERLRDPGTPDGKRNALLRIVLDKVVVEKSGQPGRSGDLTERIRVVFRSDDASEDEVELDEDLGRKRPAVAA